MEEVVQAVDMVGAAVVADPHTIGVADMDSVVAVAGAAGATRAAADAAVEMLAVISPVLPPSKRVHTSFSWTFLFIFYFNGHYTL
jgi:hypothetical protein